MDLSKYWQLLGKTAESYAAYQANPTWPNLDAFRANVSNVASEAKRLGISPAAYEQSIATIRPMIDVIPALRDVRDGA